MKLIDFIFLIFLFNVQIKLIKTSSKLKYIGCYADNSITKDLNLFSLVSLNMTIDLCGEFCTNRTTRFIGLQNQSQCYCSNSFGTYGIAPSDQQCNLTCIGNSSTICGGINYNSVYATKHGL